MRLAHDQESFPYMRTRGAQNHTHESILGGEFSARDIRRRSSIHVVERAFPFKEETGHDNRGNWGKDIVTSPGFRFSSISNIID